MFSPEKKKTLSTNVCGGKGKKNIIQSPKKRGNGTEVKYAFAEKGGQREGKCPLLIAYN